MRTDSPPNHIPVIGVIGGIGAGKSMAAAALSRHGGRIIAGDPVGHAALVDPMIRERVAKHWPAAIEGDGTIDRKRLGRIVFGDPSQLKELEGIVFPWIADRLRMEIDAARRDSSVRYIVLDAAVMLEAGWQTACDKIVFVDAPRAIRAERVARRGWTVEELDRRERAQLSLEDKKSKSHAVLNNADGPEELWKNADALLARWGLIDQPT